MENERKSSQLDSLVEDKINMHVKSANNLLALCNHLIRSIDEIITRITSQKDNQHSPKSNEARGLNGKPTNLILSYSFSLSLILIRISICWAVMLSRRCPRFQCVTVTIKQLTFINKA